MNSICVMRLSDDAVHYTADEGGYGMSIPIKGPFTRPDTNLPQLSLMQERMISTAFGNAN